MLTKSLILSLLAGTTIAQLSGKSSKTCVESVAHSASSTTAPGYGPTSPPQASSGSTPSTIHTVTSAPTIELPTTLSSSTSATSTSTPIDDDQPDPDSTDPVPVSEMFNPTNAPIFSLVLPVPSFAPVLSGVLSGVAGIIPTGLPEFPQYPNESAPRGSLSTKLPTETPASESSVTSAAPTVTSSSIPVMTTSCTTGKSDAIRTPLGAERPTGAPALPGLPPLPTGIGAPHPPSPAGPGSPALPAYPTGTGTSGSFSAGAPGFGFGRPRPTGFWPGRGYPYPANGYGRGHGRKPRPSMGSQPSNDGNVKGEHKGKGSDQAKSTPCTLETRVRPSATPPPLVR